MNGSTYVEDPDTGTWLSARSDARRRKEKLGAMAAAESEGDA